MMHHGLNVGGLQRQYALHVPPQLHAPVQSPLVLALHGRTQSAEDMARLTGFNSLADREGFVVVYPAAVDGMWNSGNLPAQADDVAFIRDVVMDVSRIVAVDHASVYACGVSNGGSMCYRLANETDLFAAIASVAGTMGQDACSPSRPVSVLHFHGVADRYSPFAGGIGREPGVRHKSVGFTIDSWVAANGCIFTPLSESLPNRHDGTRIIRRTHGEGKDDSEVVLYEIAYGGHTWPGAPHTPLTDITFGLTSSLSASDEIWRFFQRHSRG